MSTSAAAAFFALTPERILTAAEVGGRRATGRVQALGSLENRVDLLDDQRRRIEGLRRP